MTTLRVLIADDERPARQKLRRLLSHHADVGSVFEAATGTDALRLIAGERPDLVFLDIQMSGLTGIEVLRALPSDAAPHVIFVTAYDQYAVEAFDLAAVDYLLKPYDRERFERAWGRARDALRSRERREDLERALRLLSQGRAETVERLLVEDGGRTVFVPVREIERLEAERNYVLIHAPPHRYRMRVKIGAIEQRLDPRRFARLGRGLLVNLDRIVEMVPAGHGDADVRLTSGVRVRLSRRYRHRLDALRAAGEGAR
ncbi:MAG TPA: LytTR family DNA-binding domain-containing protein [Gemmatimonadaceae bacterium]|nr:LytTR family DNA-binding domain-containing protein [Gemmatimonadaceae bacterium]